MSPLYAFLPSVIFSLWFIVIRAQHVIPERGSWAWRESLAIVWALGYGVIVLYSSELGALAPPVVTLAIGPAAITAVLLGLVTTSWLSVIATALATALAVAAILKGATLPVAMMAWNLAAAFGFHWTLQRRAVDVAKRGLCPACRYDCRPVTSGRCPECGAPIIRQAGMK